MERLYAIARGTGQLARMIVFGSFVTTKAEPNDVDVFLLMADGFDVSVATGETRLLFDHLAAEAHFGASVFWLRRLAATYDQFIEPILRYLAAHPDGAPARDVHDAAADALRLSDADRAEVLPSGVQRVYKNRVGWAHDRLKRAKLSASPRRGYWQLTEAGQVFARDHPSPLSLDVSERSLGRRRITYFRMALPAYC